MTPKHDDTNSGSSRPERNVLKGTLGRASGGTFEEIPPTQNHNSTLLAMHLVMASMRSSTTADNPLDREEYDPISATMDCSTVAPMRRPICQPCTSPCTGLRGGETRCRFLPSTPWVFAWETG